MSVADSLTVSDLFKNRLLAAADYRPTHIPGFIALHLGLSTTLPLRGFLPLKK